MMITPGYFPWLQDFVPSVAPRLRDPVLVERDASIRAALKEGIAPEELGRRYGLAPSTVKKIARRSP